MEMILFEHNYRHGRSALKLHILMMRNHVLESFYDEKRLLDGNHVGNVIVSYSFPVTVILCPKFKQLLTL